MSKNGRRQFSWPADRSWLSSKDAVERSLSILHNDRARSTVSFLRTTGAVGYIMYDRSGYMGVVIMQPGRYASDQPTPEEAVAALNR